MTDIVAIMIIFFGGALVAYAGAHSNISAEKVYIAIELCKSNGGLEYIDWSSAGCKNGAKISLSRNRKGS